MHIHAKQNFGISLNVTYWDTNGVEVTPAAGDTITCVIGHLGETAKLTVTSAAPTVNGSSFTKGSPNVLRLDASDLVFPPGIYSITFTLTDDSDADEPKAALRGVFSLEDT